jgi:hypothetical protein
MSFVINNLFIGDINNANNLILLNKKNISTVVSISSQHKLDDNNIIKHFYEELDFWIFEDIYNIINSCEKKNKNILIYCDKGTYDSTVVVLYYIIKKYNCSINNACGYLQRRRPTIRFYSNYMNLLKSII